MRSAASTLMALSSLAVLSACAEPYDPGAMAYSSTPVFTTDPTYQATAAAYATEPGSYYFGGPIYMTVGGYSYYRIGHHHTHRPSYGHHHHHY